MKKTLYFISIAVELALLIGMYIFNSYTIKKLGMVRFVNFYNNKLEATCPINGLLVASVCLFTVIMISILFIFIKGKKVAKITKIKLVSVIVSVIVTIGYGFFNFYYSIEELRAYYFICIMFEIALLIQQIRTILLLKLTNEK